MKKWKLGLLAICILCLLAGCMAPVRDSQFSPTSSSIYVTREGGISSATVVRYEDRDYYDENGLRAFVESNIQAYNNQAQRPEGVKLQSCTLKDGVGTVILDYQAAQDLVRFAKEYEDKENQVSSIQVAPLSKALAQNLFDAGAMVKPQDNQPVSAGKLAGAKRLTAVVCKGAATIQTQGKILYATKGVSLAGPYTAKVPEGENCIIFK